MIRTARIWGWQRARFRAILIAMRSLGLLAALALAALALAALAGCGKQVNPEYCESALHAQDPICHQNFFLDAGIDAAISCSSDPNACKGTSDPYCDSKGICVQCTMNSQCTLDQPICDPSSESCRGCSVDAECGGAGAVCLPTGACADASEIVYVTQTGNDDNSCLSLAMACETLSHGVSVAKANNKHYLVVMGTIKDNTQIDYAGPLMIIGRGATLTADQNDQPLLDIQNASNVDLWSLNIDGSQQQNNAPAVILSQGGTQTVGIHHVAITGGAEPANNNSTRPAVPGVLVQSGKLTMEKSIVAGFEQVCIEIDAGADVFDLENNFISDCGYQKPGTGSTYGGVAILVLAPTTSTFAWNTVAYNGVTNDGKAAGVDCVGGVLNGSGNLFWQNAGGPDYAATCGITNSLKGQDPKFKVGNAPPYDLHLTSASTAAIDQAGKGCPAEDYDDGARPYGASCDFGGDEYGSP